MMDFLNSAAGADAGVRMRRIPTPRASKQLRLYTAMTSRPEQNRLEPTPGRVVRAVAWGKSRDARAIPAALGAART